MGIVRSGALSTSDSTLQTLVYLHALILILAGVFIIANYKYGGLLVALSMMGFMMTKDNPLLGASEESKKLNL
jgi:hypothetical protein